MSSGDEWILAPYASDATDKTTWEPSITWGVSPNDYIQYCYKVGIVGPKGVPHH